MDHQLENLGPERFQQLSQALLVKEFPGIICLPVGQPDGGRDALRYVTNVADPRFTVYQVKYSRTPRDGGNARKWVLETSDNEVEKIGRLIEKGANQYVFVTNVPGTSHLDVGSIDKLQSELSDKFGLPVLCWWRDDINRRLDGNWDIKLRYPEVLSGQDFFRLLLETTTGREHERRLRALRAFLAEQYVEDLEVKFKQVELQNKLLDLFVDLPFSVRMRLKQGAPDELASSLPFHVRIYQTDARGGFIVEDVPEEPTYSGTATLLLSEIVSGRLNQVVVEGAPGQGKSTLAQYLCQVHRIRLLEKADDLEKLPPEHKQTALRIPFKVDLRDIATWLDGADPFTSSDQPSRVPEPRSLETFLVRLVRQHCGGIEFDVNDLLEVSRLAPLLFVLDGLDEVADIKQRTDVVSAVSRAVPRLRENCKGLQVVITSRPAAFANSPGFDSEQFPHLQLGSVRRTQIQLYAGRWMDARTLSPKERAEFQSILDEKLNEPHLRDLARNPMQLTILLSLIHTQGAALPDKRTSLYDEYVRLFFAREAAKNMAVRQHIELLKDIHRYLGWVLHSNAEIGRRRTSGRISSKELKSLLETYLRREQYSTAVVDEVFGAMLERVVMIVPRIQGTYEFEVQPLREYFAARYLYDTASYSPPGNEKTGTKPDRFDAIARNFYWLNVVRFFCGCFSKGELLDLADRVKDLISEAALGRSRHPVMLGAMLLADWVFAQSPKAVAEVAGVLSTRDSVRRLLPEPGHYRGGQTIQIPLRCGGAHVLSEAFDFLEDIQTREDIGQRLAEFITANGTREEIDARWLASAQGPLGGDAPRWLRIGRGLGSLSRAEKFSVIAVIGNGALDRQLVKVLYDAGRCDCILTSDTNELQLVSHVFSAVPSRRYLGAVGAPPFLLPAFLSLNESWTTGGRYLFSQFSGAVKRFKVEARSPTEPEFSLSFDFTRQAFEFSCEIADLAENGALGFNSADTWEDLIESCRQIWGERPSIIAAAISICHMRRGSRSRIKRIDFLDRNLLICDRIRFAKSKAKNTDWWKTQLIRAQDPASRFLFHLCYWTWRPIAGALEIAEDIGASLDALPFDEWSILLDFISASVDRDYFIPGNQANANLALPRSLNSRRLALLVGIKARAQYGRAAFLDYLNDATEPHPAVAEFRQDCAFEAAVADTLDWRSALAIIRSTYTEGAASDFQRALMLRRSVMLPETVSRQILANAKDYPMQLWELAENVASANARKAVQAVSIVARRERWFSD